MDARDAVAAVRREAFIPDVIWVNREDGWSVPVRRGEEPDRWAELAASEDSIVIQMDDGGAVDRGAWPTSSSTGLDGIIKMIDALELRRALDRAGYAVRVVQGDGTNGHAPNAPYDRIIATASVHTLPYAWVEQTRPGGIVLAPWAWTFHPDGPVAKLVVGDEGTAEGRFLGPGFYMPVRDHRVSQSVLQETREAWGRAGEPDCTRYGVTVTPDGQQIWLDSPDNPVA